MADQAPAASVHDVPSSAAEQQEWQPEENELDMTEKLLRYQTRIDELSSFLPDYEILKSKFYFERATIKRIDSVDNNTAPSEVYGFEADESWDLLYEFLTGDLAHVSTRTRVIMAEDISWTLFLVLGATFSLNPEFFIEHLHQQIPGYAGAKGLYMGEWATWNVKKPYMSTRWYRPVVRNRDVISSAKAGSHVDSVTSLTELPRKAGDIGPPSWKIKTFGPAYNILRSKWDLSTSSNLTALGLAAIEERVSIYNTVFKGHEIIIMLLDPLPTKWDAEWTAPYRDEPEAPYVPPLGVEIKEEINPIYKCLVPRYTPYIAHNQITEPKTGVLRNQYDIMPATIMSLQKFFEPGERDDPESPPLFRSLPFWFMFRIIAIDTLGLLHLLDNVLGTTASSVAQDSLDIDYLLRQRALIAQLQSQLPALNRSIIASLTKLQREVRLNSPGQLGTEDAGSPDPTIDEVKECFVDTIKRLDETAKSLMGNLQFVESHRGITEAENVTRLTELAFFFIPLTFASSVFSMQVKELNQPVSVWIFVALGLSLCGFSYLLRLIIRSSLVHYYKNTLMTKVREHSNLSPNSAIPATAFVAWLYAKFGPAAIFALCLVSILAPALAVLWTREMGHGLKVVVTIVLVVFVALLGGFLIAEREIRRLVLRGIERSWYKGARTEDDGMVSGAVGEQPNVQQGRRRRILERVFAPYINRPRREAEES